jgi:hypothetical protein
VPLYTLQGGQPRRADGLRQDRRDQPRRPRSATAAHGARPRQRRAAQQSQPAGQWWRAASRIIHFCFHLQQLVRAGVPILEGLTDLRDSLEHPRFREVVASLIESIEGGQTLSQAMDSHRRVFNQVFVSLIRAGETTGRLPEVLQSLNESLKWEDELASQTKKMVAYPAFVGTIVHRRHLLSDDLHGAATQAVREEHGAGAADADQDPVLRLGPSGRLLVPAAAAAGCSPRWP